MNLYNINFHSEKVSFIDAVKKGLGKHQGLFFPEYFPEFKSEEINQLLKENFIKRSCKILSVFIQDEINFKYLLKSVKDSFSFVVPFVKISSNISVLELFHGPTLAFKDFGSRFMANILNICQKKKNEKITILTATSGDTGAAVAHAFYGMKNIRVIILYPKNGITKIQEKLFCCLGKNIKTIAVNGNFDMCQDFVKKSFDDIELKTLLNLNSANSINISRLLAQICYYFEAVSKVSIKKRNNLVISVPCGNFGNLTAGFFAKALGLPIKKFFASTNVNDTIPRYLATKIWSPKKTIATIANAMDVSIPNNWPRIEELFRIKNWNLNSLLSCSVDDKTIAKTIENLDKKYNYISDPHTAIAYRVLKDNLKKEEHGIFLSTAHPAKFQDIIEKILNKKIYLPKILLKYINSKSFSQEIKNFKELRKILIESF